MPLHELKISRKNANFEWKFNRIWGARKMTGVDSHSRNESDLILKIIPVNNMLHSNKDIIQVLLNYLVVTWCIFEVCKMSRGVWQPMVVDHGRPWLTMFDQWPWLTMVDHGQSVMKYPIGFWPWLTMFDHGAKYCPWSTMFWPCYFHCQNMVDHGPWPWSEHGLTMVEHVLTVFRKAGLFRWPKSNRTLTKK